MASQRGTSHLPSGEQMQDCRRKAVWQDHVAPSRQRSRLTL